MIKRQYLAVFILSSLFITGCNSPAHTSNPIRYQTAGQWFWKDLHGQNLQTRHYVIHTTVTDPDKLNQFAAVMELANQKYQTIFAAQQQIDQPLEICYFATYQQWADYTIATIGDDSQTYLSVFNGAYCVGDKFVCWDGNHLDTLSSAAHEGFHQYVSRHFKTRLPPTLEEGIATTFETVRLDGSNVTIDTIHNPRREAALHRTLGKPVLPLDVLLRIHAGDLADRPPEMSELYYAQAWSLARMLDSNPGFHDVFIRMIRDIALGQIDQPIGLGGASQTYSPKRSIEVFERYFGPISGDFEQKYLAYMRQIARHSGDDRE